ncbi:MAG TPA: alanine--tRNA ligase [Termitinemataceae bacterium]|uniref:alanine--tRNA ligase n=1 Tax=Treponema sp. J25 TaxID=2094121 RepID=UPI00104C14B1|nr:alanine--tRNA ligase [Treponema sp. J25]TCW60345.1 alanine--tRNA ligase [Treponema sp. J25]HOJ98799.1 alanine--tRNA ligase [Termitinemataceae bacterium]HOM23103.1 alanine--tRNA ligase [Termitinemataceae bacterium]HPP99953.1 alanine--tRNA ligase [Termitinemataceae bacterium]
MDANELRTKYIEFFKSKGHVQIQGKSLIPDNDPTVLFTTAGMHPLVPYILGEPHPAGTRLTNYQKCIRTGDIESVGDASHLTFFEMLGNWSLGDYFKEEAISMSFEFLTDPKWLGIPIEKIGVTVFAGEPGIPRDEESAAIWKRLGIPEERIRFLPREDNWWGPAGTTGPCGPDTEMFIDTGRPACGPDCGPGCKCGKWLEIWNDVFMQYNKTADGSYVPLSRKCVDTGMGIERTVTILNGKKSVYETEIFLPLIRAVENLAGYTYGTDPEKDTSVRIICDHGRASTFILGDPKAVTPSNVGAGYVLRRLIRRAVRHGRKLGINRAFLSEVAAVVVEQLKGPYPELEENRDRIFSELQKEENKFLETLQKGEHEFEKILPNLLKDPRRVMSGRLAFKLYDTYGFPIELTEELAAEHGLSVNREEFDEAFKKHQELSRAGSEQVFKGGLADHGEMAVKYHTATHLLHKALKIVLGDHVAQKGSNITSERLRFDFSHPMPMTPEEIARVEAIVNEQIQRDLPVTMEIMSLEEAKAAGAIALFGEKYESQVKVYTIGDFSKEVCGGPHVDRTGKLGKFKIQKEQSSSAGVRRIRAVLE